ncbi:MAG TPA: hypothetical protein RMH99_21650 [Sandaracinaceae bacterium LLY-WYZ-13_1]|nr:hypothetical protein [Sandaracinaceae bacterium LLY-WYZ-13_1]
MTRVYVSIAAGLATLSLFWLVCRVLELELDPVVPALVTVGAGLLVNATIHRLEVRAETR